MGNSFEFNEDEQRKAVDDSIKALVDTADGFNQAVKAGIAQYNEARKKAEDQLDRGARLTKHQIDL